MKLRSLQGLALQETLLPVHLERPSMNLRAIVRTTVMILFWGAALLIPVLLYLMSPGDPSASNPSF